MTDWITHDGGPCPVPPETIVTVLFHDETESHEFPASVWQWKRDVKAYRIVSPQPPASPVKMVPKIVPGTYGILNVVPGPNGKVSVSCALAKDVTNNYTAPELRDAARILTELADAMEAGE